MMDCLDFIRMDNCSKRRQNLVFLGLVRETLSWARLRCTLSSKSINLRSQYSNQINSVASSTISLTVYQRRQDTEAKNCKIRTARPIPQSSQQTIWSKRSVFNRGRLSLSRCSAFRGPSIIMRASF